MIKKFLIAIVFITSVSFLSCQKEDLLVDSNNMAQDEDLSKASITSTFTEYAVNPQTGKPSSTNYYFQVYDPAGSLALSVKLYDKASGSITYLPMTRIGTNWVLSTKITTNGWYDYRYVYSATKANISTTAYTLCNTRSVFDPSNISSIRWPFGADGSSWSNRTVIINGISQSWAGGQEGGSGYGWNEGTHTVAGEYYSDDWNRGTGSQDLGAIIRSPLDGTVYEIGTYSTELGTSKFVSIKQESNGKTYKFYVGHLQTTENSLYVGKYVRAGIDPIGTLGSSGASAPHAHCSLRDITGGARTSIKFYFNAQ